MNLGETLELLRCLSAAGATHFKSSDFEVTLSRDGGIIGNGIKPNEPSAPIQDPVATEKIKEMIETLKLDDAALMDKIFPAGAGG